MKITTRCHRIRQLPILACILISLTATSQADIITDGSVGPSETLGGQDYHIPEGLGTMTWQNLFHSFQTFSVFKGESATFTGPDAKQ
ncbi:MAG: hypothetical protein B6245_16500 [Desulfobacteraceae bacterium 4572_88]|nr:MAG: hypothetical protein B6245_16500 [Desulfobacteraceae bacterium 4572_88]